MNTFTENKVIVQKTEGQLSFKGDLNGWILLTGTWVQSKKYIDELIHSLRKRTRAVAAIRKGKKYVASIKDNSSNQPELHCKEHEDLPEEILLELFYKLVGNDEVASKYSEYLTIKAIPNLNKFPYHVWNRVETLDDKEIKSLHENIDSVENSLEYSNKIENLANIPSLIFDLDKSYADLDRLEKIKLIDDYIKNLTDRQNQVIQMRSLENEEYTYKEIGIELGIDASTVREHEKAAIEKLRKLYKTQKSKKIKFLKFL